MPSLGPTLLFIVLAAVAGYVFGMIDSRFTSSLKKKPQELPPAPPEDPGLLKVSLDKDKKIRLTLDGFQILDPAAMSVEQRQKLVNVIVQIRPWLDGKPVQVAPVAPVSPVTPVVAVAPAPGNAQPAVVPQPIARPASPAQSASIPEDLRISPVKGIASMVTKDVKAVSEKKPATIVGMIDEVLQARLAGSPLKNRGIKLEDGAMGGVIVCVGSERFEGVGNVPDPEIRDFIKAAIAEWEKR
jgi:hypothetical protein